MRINSFRTILGLGTFQFIIALVAIAWIPAAAKADLSLETETARPVKPGHFELGTAFEFQNSPNGEEYALPAAFEFGVVDRLEMLIEPVPFTSVRPPGGPRVSGLGDTEITLSYLAFREQPYIPAIAVAGEIKIPTARNLTLGDRRVDYRVYVVASKRIGDFDVHANLGYNIIGEPAHVKTKNPIDAEFAVEWFVHPKFDLFAEVTYVGSSLKSSGSGETTAAAGDGGDGGTTTSTQVTAEVAGEEIVYTAGLRYHLTDHVDVFGSFSYDNLSDRLYRTGITWKF